MKRPITDLSEASHTKDRIMLEAAMLFAHRGYSAVTIRDIAQQVKIKPASIYNHFAGKEALFEAILENIKAIYLNFYDRMDAEIAKAGSFADVLECLFSELKEVYLIFTYYGVSLVTTEQFRDAKARDIFNNVLVKIGIDYSVRQFDMSIEKGWVKPFDTRAMAILFNNSVFMGSLVRTHEHMGHETPYDVKEMFTALQQCILDSVDIIAPPAP